MNIPKYNYKPPTSAYENNENSKLDELVDILKEQHENDNNLSYDKDLDDSLDSVASLDDF